MMNDLKGKVRKLMFNLYFLGTFVFFLCLLTLLTPHLLQHWGPAWLGEILGPKVVKDTLSMVFYFLALSFIVFLGICFFYLFKIFKHMENLDMALLESGRKSFSLGQRIAEKGQRFFAFWDKQNQLLNSFSEDHEKERSVLRQHQEKLESYLRLTRNSLQALEKEKVDERKSEMGNRGQITENESFQELRALLAKMQEILFQTQVLAFNTGLEFNRSESAEESAQNFGPLMAELDHLLQKGGEVAGRMEKTLNEEGQQLLTRWASEEENWKNHFRENEQVLHRVKSAFHEVLEKSFEMEKNLKEVKALLNSDKKAPFLHWRDWEEENGRLTEVLLEIGQDLKKLGYKMGMANAANENANQVINVLDYRSSSETLQETLKEPLTDLLPQN